MKPGRMQETTAAIWATCALINGGIALNDHNEAVRADSAADVYEQQGDYAQASQWEAVADDERGDRNLYSSLTVLNLGLVGLYGSLAVAKRREQEE